MPSLNILTIKMFQQTLFLLCLNLILISFSESDFNVFANEMTTKATQAALPPFIVRVQGQASKSVKPDQGSVYLALQEESENLNEAMNSVNDRANFFIKTLQKVPIPLKYIQTSQYRVSPVYRQENRQQIMTGYKVYQSFKVLVDDLELLEPLLNKAGELKLDEIGQITFLVRNKEKHLRILQGNAIKNARKNAEILAQQLGKKVGELVSFQNLNQNQSIITPRTTRFAVMDSPSSTVSLPTGENTFEVKVELGFLLE